MAPVWVTKLLSEGQDHFDRFALRVYAPPQCLSWTVISPKPVSSSSSCCCCWWTYLSCYATRPHFMPRTILEQLLLLLLGRNIYWCKAYFMGSSSHLPAVYPQNNLIFQQGLILVEDTNRLPNVHCFSLSLFLSFDSINSKTITIHRKANKLADISLAWAQISKIVKHLSY